MMRSAGSCYGGALSGLVASLSGEGASATKLFAATSLASQVAGISGSFLFTKLYGLGLGMHSRLGSALPYVVASVSSNWGDCDRPRPPPQPVKIVLACEAGADRDHPSRLCSAYRLSWRLGRPGWRVREYFDVRARIRSRRCMDQV